MLFSVENVAENKVVSLSLEKKHTKGSVQFSEVYKRIPQQVSNQFNLDNFPTETLASPLHLACTLYLRTPSIWSTTSKSNERTWYASYLRTKVKPFHAQQL